MRKDYMHEIKEVLVFAAENGYANEAVQKTQQPDGSTTIHLQTGDWNIDDNYFTSKDGRRYHGRLVVSLGKRAMWFCGYSGFVAENAQPGEVYAFLKSAMLHPEPDFPVRGPWHFKEGENEYVFRKTNPSSTLDRFETVEMISIAGTPVYEGIFYGGKIN